MIVRSGSACHFVIACFDDDRYPNIQYEDIEQAIKATVPLAIREKEKLAGLRAWAKSSARFASVQVNIRKNRRAKGSKEVQML